MTSNRPKHIDAMHQPPLGSDATQAPCSLESQRDQSTLAAMEKTSLGIAPDKLMESITRYQRYYSVIRLPHAICLPSLWGLLGILRARPTDTESVRWMSRVNIDTIRFRLVLPTRFSSRSIASNDKSIS